MLINPMASSPVGDEIALGWEGVPCRCRGLRGVVPRHLRDPISRHRARRDISDRLRDGGELSRPRRPANECDHLDGILYPQQMADHRLLVYTEELQRHPIDLAEFLQGEGAPTAGRRRTRPADRSDAAGCRVPRRKRSHAARCSIAAGQVGTSPVEATALFQRGGRDLVAGFSRWADRRMLDWCEAAPPGATRTPTPARSPTRTGRCASRWSRRGARAVRRALAVLKLPPHAAQGSPPSTKKSTASPNAAGDHATDFSVSTKRATLARRLRRRAALLAGRPLGGFCRDRVPLSIAGSPMSARLGEARERH